jgi:hypothetical protein
LQLSCLLGKPKKSWKSSLPITPLHRLPYLRQQAVPQGVRPQQRLHREQRAWASWKCLLMLFSNTHGVGDRRYTTIGDALRGREPDPSDVVEFDSINVGDKVVFLCPGDRQEEAIEAFRKDSVKIEDPPEWIIYKGEKLLLNHLPMKRRNVKYLDDGTLDQVYLPSFTPL